MRRGCSSKTKRRAFADKERSEDKSKRITNE